MISSKNIVSKWMIMFICFFLLWSCEDSTDTYQQLQGKWLIQKAERNNEPTTTLQEGYLVFSPDTMIETNLPISDQPISFSIKDEIITQHSEPPINYQIEYLQQDSAVLTTQIYNYDFRFFLSRSKDTLMSKS